MAKNFISNSQESTRMFKSDLLEALSKVHFMVPVYLFVPVILGSTYLALFVKNIGIITYIEFFLIGLFVWTFTEYIMHRFVFHYVPKNKLGLRLHFIFTACTMITQATLNVWYYLHR
jgi:4-hydroxysphinganine ceramide fatty acyl 2-hydroxylase